MKAAEGIGKTTAVALAKAGWFVVVTARRKDLLEQVAQEIGSDCYIMAGDLSEHDFVVKLFEAIKDSYGQSFLPIYG